LEDNLLSKGVGSLRTLVIGTSAMAQTIGEKFILYPALGFYLKGFVGARVPRQLEYHVKNRFVLLGSLSQLKTILKKYSIQVVILAEHFNESILKNILDVCRQQGVSFYTVAQFYGLISTQIQIKDLDGIPLIGIKPLVIRGWKRAVKRIFDLSVAGGLLIFLSPIFFVTAIAVWLTSPGPIFYTQTRVSKNGKNFEFIKFRSMRVDAESKTGPVHTLASKKKPLTPIGGFLRRSSIDELPQLLNVLKGDMSLVGPRPERPYFVKEYESKIKNYALRHAVRGGITGWAQINGRAVLTASPEEKLKYDLYYIENWSLFFDIKIILRTVLDVLRQRNAV
jgi:putative colanic acid biosynthesis UDP-glucose lipid carrier transferase